MNELSTNASRAIENVKARRWIIASLNESGNFSINPNPVAHESVMLAEKEASRLAKLNPGTGYIVLQFRSGKLVPKVLDVQEF
jgi:hypothetical protein